MDREYSEITAQLSGLLRVLRHVDEEIDFSDLLSKTTATEEARRKALTDIEALRSARYSGQGSDPAESDVLDTLRVDLDRVSRDVVSTQREVDQLVFQAEDAALLISDLEKNLVQIEQARATGAVLGAVIFSFCPSCLSPIAEATSTHECHLCKREVEQTHDSSRYARMRNELEMQLKESKELQKGREQTKASLGERLSKYQRIRMLLSEELLDRSRHYLTEADAKIDELTKRVGFLERELLEIDRERRLGEEVALLSAKKKQLNDDLSSLRHNIASWIEAKELRQRSIYGLISRLTAKILEQDIPSDIEPVGEGDVRFDFGDNDVVINNKRGYSASSLAVIKNAFHLALLFASCLDERMKYPRFLLLDNVEDAGMTPERSQNFQRTMLDLSQGIDVEHQIIFSTSMPEPTMDDPQFTVGPKYTGKNMSLRMA